MSILILLFSVFSLVAILGLFVWQQIKKKGVHIWLAPYLLNRPLPQPPGKKHLVLAFVDHYEPQYLHPTLDVERARVDKWVQDYPKHASKFVDVDGYHPKHTFFYPEEEYRFEHLEKLVNLCRDGYGEIEIHLHHSHDTEAGLRQKLLSFTDILSNKHDALPKDPITGKPVFAFIHGNWCLDNSGTDGEWCGVNNELIVLREMGCYADFTFPSAPSATQPKLLNTIYYATDNPNAPKSYDTGDRVKVGGQPSGDLMLIQGPLGFNTGWRKWGFIPKLENCDIRASCPPLKSRIDFWVNQHIHVENRPEWTFIKIHTHGTQERDTPTLLGPQMDELYLYLQSKYRDELGWDLHYVSAREMYNIVKAAEAGKTGSPGQYRDFVLAKPAYRRPGETTATS
jgi:hypothetical protein